MPAVSGLDRSKFLPVSANWKEVKLRKEAKERKLGVINPRKREVWGTTTQGYGRHGPAKLASCEEKRWKYLFIYPLPPTPPRQDKKGEIRRKAATCHRSSRRTRFQVFWQAKWGGNHRVPAGPGPLAAVRESPRNRRSWNSGRRKGRKRGPGR